MLTRRNFLKVGAGAVATAAGIRPAAARELNDIPIGLQLYSVRADCKKDLAGTVKAVAEMGYDGVEFAGYWGRNADELKELLDDSGLKCCGTHTHVKTIQGDELKKTAEFHRILGNKFLIVPSLPGNLRGNTAEKWIEVAKFFSEVAERAKPLGMRVGYHNHSYEFKKIGDTTGWDIFFSNASKDVIMQLDTGNCMGGGGDPVAILKEFGDRAATIHIKEKGSSIIGEGQVDWKSLLPAVQPDVTEWFIIEFGGGGLPVAKASLANLRKMLGK
jgi:sugar phosphate isomerase/epimerase